MKKLMIALGIVMAAGIVTFLGAFAYTGFDTEKIPQMFKTIEDEDFIKQTAVIEAALTEIEIAADNYRVVFNTWENDYSELTYYVSEAYGTADIDYPGLHEASPAGKLSLSVYDKFVLLSWDRRNESLNITLNVPQSYAGDTFLKSINGGLLVSGLSAGGLQCVTTNGKINVGGSALDSLDIFAVNGGIAFDTCTVAGQLNITSTNADIRLSAVTAAETVVRTVNGKVETTGLNSGAIDISTTNGRVDIEIAGETSAYHIDIGTVNGSVTVNETRTKKIYSSPGSPNSLTLRTTNGDIRVKFI
jgi:hypothetical protein